MSKCQRTKLLAGGRSVCTSGGPGSGEGAVSGGQNQSLAALLAAREAQEKSWATPSLALIAKGQPPAPPTKQSIIDVILAGDVD